MKLISPAPDASETKGLAFGATTAPYSPDDPHMGKDYKWSVARPQKSKRVVAPAGGVVLEVSTDGGYHRGWGNYVLIRVNRRVKSRVAHLATGTVKVRKGQIVKAGDDLGVMGATGDTYGVHLHEELLIDDRRVNPDHYRGPNGKHLPETSPVPAPATTPPPRKARGATSVALYVKAKNDPRVFEISTGYKYLVSKAAWVAITLYYKLRKEPLPILRDELTKAQVDAIPNG